ncbi:MAG TPA: hypothetical protein VI075_04580, partial [Methyloceanibacter sp.]
RLCMLARLPRATIPAALVKMNAANLGCGSCVLDEAKPRPYEPIRRGAFSIKNMSQLLLFEPHH